MKTIATTCPYCGVGCGVLATVDATGVQVQGDSEHPANLGRLCSKGSALAQTLDLKDRLLDPHIQGQRCDWETALNKVANGFKRIIREHGPDAVAIYGSGQLLTEDYYVANKLMKGFIGSANIDTNSRLCMASSVVGHKRAFGADSVPCSYEDLERAQLIVLVGSNTAWCHPVLYQRMVATKKRNPGMRVVVIDPRRTATADIADMVLTLRPGSDAMLFNGLLSYLDEQGECQTPFVENHTQGVAQALLAARETAASTQIVADVCQISLKEVETFYQWFATTDRVITVYSQGINQSSSGSDKVNAIINCHLFTGRIGRVGMGPFSFTGQPNAMGGREVGGLANQLAAHMDIENTQHRQAVQNFWQSPAIASKAGYTATALFDAIAQGKVKAVWIMATNPVVSLPEADRVIEALKKCELVVVSDVMKNTDTAAYAHVLLPAQGWGEKDGSVTNSERRISRQRAFMPSPGETRADWWIICEVAKRMGFAEGFNFSSAADIFREHAALSAYDNHGRRDFDIGELQHLTDEEYNELRPVQWPIRQGKGTSRLFADGEFYTDNRRARFIPVIPQAPKNKTSDDFPFALNTGRVRDQWHTMTRTGKVARLSHHHPEPYLAIRAEDARQVGLVEGGLARLVSRWGAMVGRVKFDHGLVRGQVFAPMHWNRVYASEGRVGAVVNAVIDPYSAQPELKHTPVRIESYQPQWHGFILSRRRLRIRGASYWAMAQGENYYRYEIAGEQLPENWPAWARSMLCSDGMDINWVEYLDAKKHAYRGVRMSGTQLESCVFIGPNHDLPPRSWLAGLFAKPALSAEEHRGLLIGKAPVGEVDAGRIVCACFSVGINTIEQAVRQQRLNSVKAIGQTLRAGTNCGSCVPELRGILAGLNSPRG
ncbi:MAG: molybdopterin-dependent oxidoreductase [Gammaproteobacteria bacterium]|nr:molybdopterin-dependent oxidoreductase [Gammaproteobacteria bacterium]